MQAEKSLHFLGDNILIVVKTQNEEATTEEEQETYLD